MFDQKSKYYSREDLAAAEQLAMEGEEAVREAERSGEEIPMFRAELARTLYLSKQSQTRAVTNPEIMMGEGNVIVVEDNTVCQRLIKRMLAKSGYKVEAFNGAKDVLEFFKQDSKKRQFTASDVDLVITDLIMPGMDGAQLASILKKIIPGIRVVYISANSAQMHGIDENNQPFLQKPYKHRELIGIVKAALEKE